MHGQMKSVICQKLKSKPNKEHHAGAEKARDCRGQLLKASQLSSPGEPTLTNNLLTSRAGHHHNQSN